MENENIENNIMENTESPLEVPEISPDFTTDVLPNQEIVEEMQETIEDVHENETGNDISQSTTTIVGSDGEIFVEMNDGSEDFYDTNTEFDYDEIMDTYNYVTNVYEIVEEEEIPLWESDISELGRTDTLLLLIFLLLLVQFIHNIFKGSHWFKG